MYVILKLKENDQFCESLGFCNFTSQWKKMIISTPKSQFISLNSIKIINNEGIPIKEGVFKKGELFIKFIAGYLISINYHSKSLKLQRDNKKKLKRIVFCDELVHKYIFNKVMQISGDSIILMKSKKKVAVY